MASQPTNNIFLSHQTSQQYFAVCSWHWRPICSLPPPSCQFMTRFIPCIRSTNKSRPRSEESDVSANGTLRIISLIPFLYSLQQEMLQFFPPSWQCNEQITQQCPRWYATVQGKGLTFYKVCILWICDSACESLAGLSGVCSLTKLSILWSDCEDVKSVIF